MNNIYLFWVGNEYKLIKILREIIYMHSTNGKGYIVNFINYDNIKNYIPDIPDYFYKLKPNHQSDFLRACILCDRGGIWLDSDTLIMDKLDDLFDIINSKDGFFIRENIHISSGVFGTKPNTDLMKLWKKTVLEILEKNINISWSEIAIDILTKIKNEQSHYFNNYHIYEGSTDMYPIDWKKCVDEFLNKPYENYKNIERSFQPLIVLVNSVYKEAEKYSKEDILNAKRPLNYFIEKSYRNKFKDLYLIYKN